jgi:hypothetical protein
MKRIVLGGLFLAVFSFTFSGAVHTPNVEAAKKRVSSKKATKTPDEPTERQKKLLGWTSAFPTTWTYTTPDFFIRGTVMDYKKVVGSRETSITILPIEVMDNPQHHIKEEHYRDGVTIQLELMPSEEKGMKKGGVVEYNQYSKEIPTEAVGHAKLVKAEIHQDFKPYDISPVAYITKPGMEPEQTLNALKGILLYQGSIEKTDDLKNALASLTKNKDPNISQTAKQVSQKLFGS